jgi:hypothetical protein
LTLPTRHFRRYLAAIAAVALMAGFLLAVSSQADGRDGLLRDRAIPGQSASDLVRRGAEQKLRCAEECLVSGNLVLSSADGATLHANGLSPRPPVRIARLRDLRLRGGRWYTVRLPLNRHAARMVRRAEGPLRLSARNLAVSLESRRFERSSWALELKPDPR